MNLPDFSRKQDLETLKTKISEKQKIKNFISLDSIEFENDPRPANYAHSFSDRRGLTEGMIAKGSLISQRKNESFSQFCPKITNIYIKSKNVNWLSFSGYENNLVNLMTLDLSGNRIAKIENLESFYRLEVLQLASNQIQKIENLSKNKKLRILNLQNNEIATVEGLDALINLKELDLGFQRGVHDLKFSENCFESSVALATLDLQGNRLENVSELCCLRNFTRKPPKFGFAGNRGG